MCGQPTGLHTRRPHRGGATPTVSARERICRGEPHPLSKRALTRGLLVDLGWASILPVPPGQPEVYTNSSPLGLSPTASPGPLSWAFCRNLGFSAQPPCIPAGARLRLWTAANRNGQGPRGSSLLARHRLLATLCSEAVKFLPVLADLPAVEGGSQSEGASPLS